MESISGENLNRHLAVFCNDIGLRLAGTAGERAAADYMVQEFGAMGVDAAIEEFPVNARKVENELLEVKIGGSWQKCECSLFSNTPGTDGKMVEAPLVFFESPAEYNRSDLSHLRDKAVVHLGCHIESREAYRRLVEARPAFVLMVDTRYPGTSALADGMFPSYANDIGAVPVLNVAFMDAWNWRLNGAQTARACVSGGMTPGTSQNVVATLPGEGDKETLYFGGHHDTQAGSIGADDNAVGSIALLELARVLKDLPRKRTVRLISFGAEEQLSVGSSDYVRKHRPELKKTGAALLNFDAFTSHMGWFHLVCNGSERFAETLSSAMNSGDMYTHVTHDISPYGDHFPFVACGIPGATLLRENCSSGRFFHHRSDDDMTRVSIPVMKTALDAAVGLFAELCSCEKLPFDNSIPVDQVQATEELWQDLFGGWEGA